MKKKITTKKVLSAGIMCLCLSNAQPAKAFIWPVVDMTQIASFTNNITTGMSQISTAKAQFENYTTTITSIGDQAGSMMKYAAELEGMMPKVKDQADNISKMSISSVVNVGAVFDTVNTQAKTSQTEESIAEKIIDDTNSGIEDGVEEDELIENIQDAKQEHQNRIDLNNELFDEAKTAITTNLTNANQAVDELVTVVVKQSELEDNVKQELLDDAAHIKAKIKNLEQDSIILLSEAEKNYAAESTKIIEAYDNYAKAVEDYFAKRITKEEFEEAGNIFRQAVTSSSSVVNKDDVENITAKINEISEDIVNLKEKILNSIGNNKDYSDEEEPQKNSALDILPTQKFAFNYQESHEGIFLTGVYSKNDGRFLYPKEFECKNRDFSTIKSIEEHLKDFRDCISAAKAEKEYWCQGNPSPEDPGCNPYKEPVYKGYEKEGVYKHLLEDYSIANIANISRIKQYVATWQDIEDENNDKATLRVLKETLDDVDNTRNAYSLLGMIDIEAPRLWSELRRIDAVYRAKETIKRYEGLETLYLDGRADYLPAEVAGKLVEVDVGDKTEDKAVFPNMMLQHCEMDAEEMSLSPKEKYDKERIKQTEKNIANCMYKYALYAGRGGEGDLLPQGDNEEVKKIWQKKQSQAMTDTSFDMLVLAVINNMRSSNDYTADSDETNIVTLQKGLKEATEARNDYAAGAEIIYYSTQQLLTIIESDAQNLQAEIAKDLSTMDYSYFGQVQ